MKYSNILEQLELESQKMGAISMGLNHPSFDSDGFLFKSWEEFRNNDYIILRDLDSIKEEDYWRWHTYLLSITNKQIIIFI